MGSAEHSISLRNGFSDRMGLSPLNKTMQYLEFDIHSRNALINELEWEIESYVGHYGPSIEDGLAKDIVDELFNERVEYGKTYDLNDVIKTVSDLLEKAPYNEVLDIVEYFTDELEIDPESPDSYRPYKGLNPEPMLNAVLENEFIGYRLINGKITKITSKEEIDSISQSIATSYNPVNEHMRKALGFLGETGKQDYKQSVKESVLALEYLSNKLAEASGKTLGDAIDELDRKKKLHPALKESIKKLYGYASDLPGARHDTNNGTYDVTFDEAKLVLVTTSAFINYAISVLKV